jgi:hypothetical protein
VLFNKDSTIKKCFRKSTLCTSQKNRFPVSRSDDRAILSGCPSVHCSIRPNDVPYRSNARQTKHQPSGRLSAWFGHAFNRYGNCGFDFDRSEACLSWSGRGHSKYGNYVLKINRPDGQPPWSGRAKPYMEITCSGRATVRITVSHRPDAALKQERFSAKISKILVAQLSVRTAHVHHPDDAYIFYSSCPFEP